MQMYHTSKLATFYIKIDIYVHGYNFQIICDYGTIMLRVLTTNYNYCMFSSECKFCCMHQHCSKCTNYLAGHTKTTSGRITSLGSVTKRLVGFPVHSLTICIAVLY